MDVMSNESKKLNFEWEQVTHIGTVSVDDVSKASNYDKVKHSLIALGVAIDSGNDAFVTGFMMATFLYSPENATQILEFLENHAKSGEEKVAEKYEKYYNHLKETFDVL